MDFSLSDEQELLVRSTRQLLTRDSPISRVRELADKAEQGFDPRVWEKGGDLGWPALPIPTEYGGLDGDLVDVALITKEHGRTVQPGPLVSHVLVALAILRSTRDDLRSRLLPDLATGETVATWAFAEPGQAWDAGGVHTEAVEHSGGFRLNGVKTAVQDAGHARLILVTALLDGELAQFLVDAGAPGLTVRRQRTIDVTRRLDEVVLVDVVVPASALLNAPGPADSAVAYQLRCGAVLISAESLGVGERVLDMTVDYAKVRTQFGRPIGSFQAVKHKCATMRMGLQASSAATYYAAMAVTSDTRDAEEAVAVAKAYTSQTIADLTSEALQVHGGIGFTWEHDLHLYHRRAKANQVLFGDPFLYHERLAAMLASSVG
ncbi:acyl-CoA/acyl-ACP dehydrogenase [Nocardia sp. NBC_00565]|uniref:acyl-CoA dehydrogenase family protein n=1 Tax=Nocardia sp. NBC_00565 TaxID=2975993 RepID=UPI002E8136B0|nr:acyl-CoA dehydrogenase family protein [Nocardia sp. NBC_00565]WUC05616.1 acyl-CoA/acyl-ACP dehydrogenase [Nocardia sp. NBC_00565]